MDYIEKMIMKLSLGSQVKEVSKALGLDILKALYIVKEYYMSEVFKSRNNNYFPYHVPEDKIVNTQKVIERSKLLLESDKMFLLECYFFFLKEIDRPSSLRLLNKVQ